ncbi:MAG TPA: accessory gene regulator B family protein [Symbiobacteriaceae bacterium]|nr:accessory gene regulator B family protein [Symbiobacteriaceae bacterium]
MSVAERLAEALGGWVADGLNLDEDRREVLVYGAMTLLQNGATILAVLILARLLGVLPEAAAAAATAFVLRHFSGGEHLSRPLRCVVFTALEFAICGAAAQTLARSGGVLDPSLRLAVAALPVLSGLVVVFRCAPVEAHTRPLSDDFKSLLRVRSRLIGTVICVVVAIGAYAGAWWAWAAACGYAVQVFSLTSVGLKFVRLIDRGCNLLPFRG